jgi:hypothetical protein
LATGCVVKSSDDDDDVGGGAGEAGDASTGGSSTGGKGGSSGSSTGGKGGSAGSATTGGSGGSGGSATGGSSGTGGDETDPECDPDSGELVNTPYPNCTASAGNLCEQCMETSCCELSRVCYGLSPGNVCGWGGPDGGGELACYVECVAAYYDENGVYDEDGVDECTSMCVTPMCGTLPGNATQDMVECVDTNCQEPCYGIEP